MIVIAGDSSEGGHVVDHTGAVVVSSDRFVPGAAGLRCGAHLYLPAQENRKVIFLLLSLKPLGAFSVLFRLFEGVLHCTFL